MPRVFDDAATIVLADGPDGADFVPQMLADAGRLGDALVVVGWLPGTRPWTERLAGARALMGGYGVRDAIRGGRAEYVPVRLSAVPRYLAQLPRPIVTVVRGRPVGGGFVCGPSVGWAPAAAALADAVVVEVDSEAPEIAAPRITGEVVATVEGTATRVPPAWPPPDAVDRTIAAHIADLLGDEPTIQFGPGSLLDAVVRHADRPVRVFSGLATDAVAALADQGRLLTPAVAGYLWGSDDLIELAREGGLELARVEDTHDVRRLSELPRLIALNTALQVGLDGSVNVERSRGDVVGGVGGHPDFARGASACPGGLSVVAVRSQHRGTSNVVEVPEVVTTARTDVDVVVTEHGVADLRGCSDDARAARLRAIGPELDEMADNRHARC